MSPARRPFRRRTAAAVAVLVLLGAAGFTSVARAADPFYSGLLSDGARAYARGDYDTAARKLRIACFGLLDEPEVLVEGLVRLGLAQARGGDRSGFEETYERLLEVEDRFGLYDRVALPREIRADFEGILLDLIPDNALVQPAELPDAEAAVVEAAEDTEGAESAAQPAAPDPPGVGKGGQRAAAKAAEPGEQRIPSPDERARFDQVRRIAASATKAEDLDLAVALAAGLSSGHPGWREAHLLAAEVTYLASRWSDSVRFYRRAGGPRAGEFTHLFYYAVALFESGEREEARLALERALPGMERTPFVESYVERIEGGS